MIKVPVSARIRLAARLTIILACLVQVAPARAEVTWLDLLSDPDNATLNRQFVSERLAEGDLPAALSAIERLMVLRPSDIPLRILRAEILVNLANDTLAEGELAALAKLPLQPEQKARVDRLQGIIESRGKRWRTAASISLGLRTSDNANNYPTSGLMDFKLSETTPASTRDYETFGGATKTVREAAGVAGTVLVATYELPNQTRDTLTAGVSHSEARGRKYNYLTSSSTTAFPGASLQLGDISLRPSLRLTETHAETSSSSTVASASLTAVSPLPFNVQSYATAEYSIVNRIPSKNFSTANQNDGHSRSFRLGLSRSITPRLTVFGEGSYSAFNPMETRYSRGTVPFTQAHANQNRRQAGSVGLFLAASPNVRLRVGVDASDSKYPNRDPTSKIYRRDTQTRSSIAMQIAGQAFSDKFDGFSLALSASTTKNDSNIRQYDYKRSDASITLRYQLED